MKAIILSAGQGSRLLPLTQNQPKCLLPINGRSILEWQLNALAANDVNDVTVVTGFHAEEVDKLVNGLTSLRVTGAADIATASLLKDAAAPPTLTAASKIGLAGLAAPAERADTTAWKK